MSLSWYVNVNINDVRNIFSGLILPYEVEVYSCSCGTNKFIIKDIDFNSDSYECEDCENKIFLDSNKYLNNYIWYDSIKDLLDEEDILAFEPTISFDSKNKELKANILLKVPSSIDLSCDKIIYSSKSLFELKILKDGTIKQLVQVNYDLESGITENEKWMFESIDEDTLVNRNPFLIEFKKKILESFKTYSKYFESKVSDMSNSLEEFSFFLSNTHLDDVDFYKWKNIDLLPNDKHLSTIEALDFITSYRTEKTLRKSIYEDYQNQIRKQKSYNFIYVYTISRCIKDVNILNRLLDINLHPHIEELIIPYDFYDFTNFLSNRFSDKQIEKLFLSYEKEELFWLIDTVSLFSEVIDFVGELELSKCRFNDLHTDIVRFHKMIMNKKLFEVSFDYEDKFLNPCVKIEDYEIKLPINGIELYDWSNSLQNCLSGYWKLIKDKQTTVYGFMINNEIRFAVEIRNNKIIQSKSKYNRDIQNKEVSLVHGWFKEYFEKKEDDSL